MDSAWIDVSRLMQRHPFITHADARVSRAYRIFRTMGLRHLYVTPDKPLVVGVMTRKDVIQENTSLTLGEKAERIMAERRSSSGGGVDREAEGADAFPGGANLYSHDYADRFKSKKNEPSSARRGIDERGGGSTANDDWNDQFGDDDDDHRSDEEEDERLPYIPYYQGNAGDDDDDDNDDHHHDTHNTPTATAEDGTENTAEDEGSGGNGGFTNISGASIVRRANGPDNL
jgi:hypothetical protein